MHYIGTSGTIRHMGELVNCPLCDYPGIKQHQRQQFDTYYMECRRCGSYVITMELLIYQDVKQNLLRVGYILSGLTRELKETGQKYPTFTTENFEAQTKQFPAPDVNNIEEKIQKLVVRLREKTEYFGQVVELGDIELAVPLAYAKNARELEALLKLMSEKKIAYVKFVEQGQIIDPDVPTSPVPRNRKVQVTLLEAGWDLSKSLGKQNQESDKGFIAVWFDDSMNESITAAEQAIAEVGYRAVCIRDEHFSERIMDKALSEIRRSRFIVVDLTGARASVYFEAGFAHGLGIETIYVYKEQQPEKDSPLDFYVRHYQCHKYKDATDLKDVLKTAISARIAPRKK